ncbi:MAG: hypothetical protein JSU85_14555 [Candidatus Zixiibacteriota bacterium]|nr:MAG: hypothetical protein JSU85_14555 [candidate division Zixibacteria bacterium]
MGDTRSGKIDLMDIFKRYLSFKGALKALLVIAVLSIVLIALNNIVLPLLGYKLRYNSGRFKVTEYIRYSRDESRVLSILIRDTIALKEIPQFQYLKAKTGLENDRLGQYLRSLADKGDIVLNDSGFVVDAYPWTSRETGILVYLDKDDQSTASPLKTPGALYAMSVMPFFELNGRIEAVLEDTDDVLTIEIENNEIIFTGKITAVAYRTDDYKDSRFFSSPDDARAYYHDNFDIERVIRIDRALLIGNIIAKEIKGKIEG